MVVKTPINFKAKREKIKKNSDAAMRKLVLTSILTFFFIAIQIVGGYLAKSIAIFTDSAHMASDMIGFAISIFSLKMAQKPATKSLTFGYHRSEIIGTLVSVVIIWVLTFWLVVEATDRIINPVEVKGDIMFVVACLGLVFNLIQMKILHSGDGHYHLGGSHDHDHSHDHSHDHGHSHDHKHKKDTKNKKVKVQKELKEGLIDKEA